MIKREQERLLNAAKRLVQAIRHGGWHDPYSGKRSGIYSSADHEISIDFRTEALEKVLKDIEKGRK